jgi:hypothetical protein
MSKLEHRKPKLKKVYVRCPSCNRVLKAHAYSDENLRHTWPHSKEVWKIYRIPDHKRTLVDPERLARVVLTGKGPNERPWCSKSPLMISGGCYSNPDGVWTIIGDRK